VLGFPKGPMDTETHDYRRPCAAACAARERRYQLALSVLSTFRGAFLRLLVSGGTAKAEATPYRIPPEIVSMIPRFGKNAATESSERACTCSGTLMRTSRRHKLFHRRRVGRSPRRSTGLGRSRQTLPSRSQDSPVQLDVKFVPRIDGLVSGSTNSTTPRQRWSS
jgi:hypothetical protein